MLCYLSTVWTEDTANILIWEISSFLKMFLNDFIIIKQNEPQIFTDTLMT